MLNRYFIFILISSFLLSCKKEKDPIRPGDPYRNSYMPLAIGNYWIYQSVMIDTNGVETIQPKLDSVYVLKDTLVNGNVYYYLCGSSFYNIPQKSYYCRDSSGYFVYLGGYMDFAPNSFRDTMMIKAAPNFNVQFKYMLPDDTLITVPAGTLLTSVRQWEFDFQPFYTYEKVRYMPLYRSRGIGTIKERGFVYGSPGYWESRLLRYHLE